MKDPTEIPYNQDLKLVPLDIENMYSNIPNEDLINIIKSMCLKQYLDEKTNTEFVNITHTILEQNYFKFRNQCYIQNTGLAMGAPTSAILSEIYLQQLEHTMTVDILIQNNILGYFRYVDDILIVYNNQLTDIHKVYSDFNSLVSTIKFSMETETDSKINFLDITTQKASDRFSFSIFRKLTATDIIPRDSCHPTEHKHAAIRFLLNRMNTYDLNDNNRKAEQDTIEHILMNNGYETSIIEQLSRSEPKINQSNNKSLWAKFTYTGKETKFITKLFKETSVRISYTTNNTLRKHLFMKPNHSHQNQYEKSGTYQLTRPDCKKKYVSQTGRSFQKRFQEHFRDFKYNNYKSKFAVHLLENQYSIGPINDIMEILYTTNKGRLMDTLEKNFIFIWKPIETTKSTIKIQ
jgi:hypothetical protein